MCSQAQHSFVHHQHNDGTSTNYSGAEWPLQMYEVKYIMTLLPYCSFLYTALPIEAAVGRDMSKCRTPSAHHIRAEHTPEHFSKAL